MLVIRNSNFIFTVWCFEQSLFEFEVTATAKLGSVFWKLDIGQKKVRVGDDSTASPSTAVYYLR